MIFSLIVFGVMCFLAFKIEGLETLIINNPTDQAIYNVNSISIIMHCSTIILLMFIHVTESILRHMDKLNKKETK
jgi:hypothetical protein